MPSTTGSFLWPPGCGDCCTPDETCIVVVGCCQTPIAGATVTVKNGGGTVDSGTTDANGEFCTTLATAGDVADVDASHENYAPETDLPLNIGHHNTVNVEPAAGWHCGCGGHLLDDDLVLNDGIGDVTVDWDDAENGWIGCDDRTLRTACASFASPGDCTLTTVSYPTTVPIGFKVQVGCGPSMVVSVFLPLMHRAGSTTWAFDTTATCADFLAWIAAGRPSTPTGCRRIWYELQRSCSEPFGSMTTADCDPLLLECDFNFLGPSASGFPLTQPERFGGCIWSPFPAVNTFTLTE